VDFYSQLFNVLASRFFGAVLSSGVFAYAHVTGGRANLRPTIFLGRFLAGMIFCWQADRNHYDLRKNIFAHAWYDILVSDGTAEITPVGGIKLYF
jgi:membrane protease YdiL (CAAX protease family)